MTDLSVLGRRGKIRKAAPVGPGRSVDTHLVRTGTVYAVDPATLEGVRVRADDLDAQEWLLHQTQHQTSHQQQSPYQSLYRGGGL